jgi:hypothetical protein
MKKCFLKLFFRSIFTQFFLWRMRKLRPNSNISTRVLIFVSIFSISILSFPFPTGFFRREFDMRKYCLRIRHKCFINLEFFLLWRSDFDDGVCHVFRIKSVGNIATVFDRGPADQRWFDWISGMSFLEAFESIHQLMALCKLTWAFFEKLF